MRTRWPPCVKSMLSWAIKHCGWVYCTLLGLPIFQTLFVCLIRAWSMRTRDTAPCLLRSIGHCQPMFLVHVLVRYARSIHARLFGKCNLLLTLVLSGQWVAVNPCSLYTWYTSRNSLSLRYSKYYWSIVLPFFVQISGSSTVRTCVVQSGTLFIITHFGGQTFCSIAVFSPTPECQTPS